MAEKDKNIKLNKQAGLTDAEKRNRKKSRCSCKIYE